MHSLFIVDKSIKTWFNEQAELFGNNGPAIAQITLSADGSEPGTHGWCAVKLSSEKSQAIAELLSNNADKASLIDWTQYDLSITPNHPQQRLTELGLKLIQIQPI